DHHAGLRRLPRNRFQFRGIARDLANVRRPEETLRGSNALTVSNFRLSPFCGAGLLPGHLAAVGGTRNGTRLQGEFHEMKKCFLFIAGFLLCAFTLSATDEPRFETFLGYNYVRFNPDSHIVPSFNSNGGSGQFVYNIRHYIGAAVEVGAVNNGSLYSSALDTTTVHFVAGPRFSFNTHSRWMPNGEALFCGRRHT